MFSVSESAVVEAIVALPPAQPEPFTLITLAENPTFAVVLGAPLVPAVAVVPGLESSGFPPVPAPPDGIVLPPVPAPDGGTLGAPAEWLPAAPAEWLPAAPAEWLPAAAVPCLDCSKTSPEQPQAHAA